jgi:RNA recognition motif-containing protein
MENKDKTNSNGFGAWQNVRKENEKLKTELLVEKENKFGQKIKINSDGNIANVNNAHNPFRFGNVNFIIEEKVSNQIKPIEEDEEEDEEIIVAKKFITKKKNQIKELLSICNSRKKEYEQKSKLLLDEYNDFVASNELDIEKIMKQIDVYNSIIRENIKTSKPVTTTATTANNPSENTELFVGSLPQDYTEKDLKILFSTYGEIMRCVILSTGIESKCCGFINFKTSKSAYNAIDCLNGTTPDNFIRPILVEYSNTKKKC